jgi:hypothetical protein
MNFKSFIVVESDMRIGGNVLFVLRKQLGLIVDLKITDHSRTSSLSLACKDEADMQC